MPEPTRHRDPKDQQPSLASDHYAVTARRIPSQQRNLTLAATESEQEISEFGPALISAREHAGLTQDDVAAALGLSRQLIGYWEQGKRNPRTEQMFQLAALFRTSVAGLLTRTSHAPHDAVEAAAMLYRRSNVELDEAARDGIAGFVTFLDFYADLADAMGRDVTGMTKSPFLPGEGYGEYAVDARRKASEVRHHLGLGQGPVADVDSICAALGITVYRAHLGNDLKSTISGAFYKHPAIGFAVIVNLDMTRGRRRFTTAHELAHALLHSGNDAIVVSDTGRRGDQRETYADAFAGEFLMPEEGIRRALESLGAGPKLEDVEPVIHLHRMFNVSYITALVRLRQANIITTATLHKLRAHPPLVTAARMGYHPDDSEWPAQPQNSVRTRYPLKFHTLLRDALAHDVIGRSSTEQALKLTHDEIDELIDTSPAVGEDDMNQEWVEHAALGAVPA
jgi:Zn-dependent peptidase ImmA (M78 family)/transcriptional regulator with XRE-family HTH domain